MIGMRNLSSVCLPCRLRILSQARRSELATSTLSASNSRRLLTQRVSRGSIRSLTPLRAFSSTIRTQTTQSEAPAVESKHSTDPDSIQSTLPPDIGVEEVVRIARQRYGDVLPKGHLSEEEYIVYERLYGQALFREAHELEGSGEAGLEDVMEVKGPDGSTVVMRTGKSGELEEVEVIQTIEDPEGWLNKGSEVAEVEHALEEPDETTTYHDEIYERATAEQELWEDVEEIEDGDYVRAHPLTLAGRFAPQPSTVHLPKEQFVAPITSMLTRTNHKHLKDAAERIFGGQGLPLSATTRPAREGKAQKAIPLGPTHTDMGNIESDAYLAAVIPGTYVTVMSTLVEVRRRLGSSWLEGLMKKKDGPVILDAGAGGAAVVALHEVLKAEWLRIHEESGNTSHGEAPLGKATVLTGSDCLRHRASQLLENTQFIPRLPDAVSPDDENTSQPRKLYDIVVAPHTLWGLNQEHLRKEQVQKLWSLLNPNGGVLILLEKGLPRGFEIIAAAREYLLDRHIASPGDMQIESRLNDQVSKPDEDTRFTKKETGMIIAPCTNHGTCPMYKTPGVSNGRKDFCYFSQRYIRPPFLQRILDARDRNHEDVQFSYLAVQRGRDQRNAEHDILGEGIVQGEPATESAFAGHEWKSNGEMKTPADVNPLTLPRVILPALKRRGHIILDVCTPAGALERWTVPRSFSKQAFRDARKVRWGDLWALGAKTRIAKNVRLGRPRDEYDRKGRLIKQKKQTRVMEIQVGDHGNAGLLEKTDGKGLQDRRNHQTGRKGRKKAISLSAEDE